MLPGEGARPVETALANWFHCSIPSSIKNYSRYGHRIFSDIKASDSRQLFFLIFIDPLTNLNQIFVVSLI